MDYINPTIGRVRVIDRRELVIKRPEEIAADGSDREARVLEHMARIRADPRWEVTDEKTRRYSRLSARKRWREAKRRRAATRGRRA